MKKTLAIALFLSVASNAYAVDGGAVVGGALGGAAGAAVGHNMGGQNGAILGAAIGGAAGAAIGSRPSPQVVQQVPVQAMPAREDDEEGYRRHEQKHRKHGHDHED